MCEISYFSLHQIVIVNLHVDWHEGFGVGLNTLVNLFQARKYEDLHKFGGVKLILLYSM
jgi:hypothetical protein